MCHIFFPPFCRTFLHRQKKLRMPVRKVCWKRPRSRSGSELDQLRLRLQTPAKKSPSQLRSVAKVKQEDDYRKHYHDMI